MDFADSSRAASLCWATPQEGLTQRHQVTKKSGMNILSLSWLSVGTNFNLLQALAVDPEFAQENKI